MMMRKYESWSNIGTSLANSNKHYKSLLLSKEKTYLPRSLWSFCKKL